MDEVYAVLLSWAVTLSGLPAAPMPDVIPVDHQFFVEHACNGQECKVWGWFAGGHTVYIDQRFDVRTSLLASSVLVHEFTHYLQSEAVGGWVAPPTCDQAISMERHAYGVQQEFILRYGTYLPVGASMASVMCK